MTVDSFVSRSTNLNIVVNGLEMLASLESLEPQPTRLLGVTRCQHLKASLGQLNPSWVAVGGSRV